MAAMAMMGCGGSNDPVTDEPTPVTPPGGGGGETTTAIQITSILSLNITTDKALYRPGETIRISIEGSVPSDARMRCRQGDTVVKDEALSGNSYTWTAPQQDFQGYMVDVYTKTSTTETIYGTVGVDVSSDWARFPRYGFVATYDRSKTSSVIAEETAFLNRCHINGIQYYDWHNKHHWPLGGTRTELLESYTDIANRPVVTSVVNDYIEQHHAYGMKTMFYNLCYGALNDGAQDGVQESWSLYTNTNRRRDVLSMPSGWKSDIYIMDPANKGWQDYLAERNDDVYANFDFDGFHIDQLGSRGTVYDYYGSQVNLPNGFASFINAMKARHSDKRLVMNAVSGYGASQIGNTKQTDFMYTEMWGSEQMYSDIRDVISVNGTSSGGKNTIIAGYMNYGKSGSSGTFNTPGVLLTDAVIFALGGAHLELGDGHMLCHEYFPNSNLKMGSDLQTAIVRYYDFLVAYENLLRDGGSETTADIASTNSAVSISAWPPRLQSVCCYAKTVGSRQVVHLLNFRQANSLSWRDEQGNMPEPQLVSNLPLKMKASSVKKVWVASPDALGGVPQELSFKQEGDNITFTLPSLKYWTMIVIEH